MARDGYATANRKRILEYLQQNGSRTVTVADIDDYLRRGGSEVNVTTIYRYLDKLVRDGTLIQYTAEKGGRAAYQYVGVGHRCGEHLHLKCVRCGLIIHLECAFMDEIAEHVQKEHGFALECKNSVLYGVCENCRKKACCEGKDE